jgi:hypothetical protein
MTRRQFLAASAFVAAGCGRRAAPSADADAARIADDKPIRQMHLAMAEKCRVPPSAVRTTPKPPVDVLSAFPELKGLAKVAVRLHPRFSDEPKPDESKFGGRFLWAGEPWPECPEFHIPMAAVLQLRAEDAPPTLKFLPGSDLLQVFWSPREPKGGELPVSLHWRKRSAVGESLADPPSMERAFLSYVPVPCRVFPERVTEFPDWDTLSKTALRAKVEAWTPPPNPAGGDPLSGPLFYDRFLSAARGTKAGGYPRWPAGTSAPPACPHCKWGMDFLLTVDSAEWDRADAARWRPAEEKSDDDGCRRAAGLMFTGNVQVFVCRRCDGWPAKAAG